MAHGMTDRMRWAALIVLCLGDLMIVLDTTIVNVALPSIRGGPRLLADLARVGRERVPAHLRRLSSCSAGRLGDLFRPPADVPGRDRPLHACLGGPAGLSTRRRRMLEGGARGAGFGGARSCPPVAFSLIMFPVHRAGGSAQRRWGYSDS